MDILRKTFIIDNKRKRKSQTKSKTYSNNNKNASTSRESLGVRRIVHNIKNKDEIIQKGIKNSSLIVYITINAKHMLFYVQFKTWNIL